MNTPSNEQRFIPVDNPINQEVRPPQTDSFPDHEDDDNETKHRGLSRPKLDRPSDPALAPRNAHNGQPGFDAAEKIRSLNPKDFTQPSTLLPTND
jgi:hypothetical protein